MTISQMLGWAVFGLVAGALARLLHPGRDPMSWLWTMLLGIAGAVSGGYLAGMMNIDASNGLASWVAAVVGAVILLAGYHFLTSSRTALSTPSGTPTSSDYKDAVFNDLSRGPNG